MKLFQIVPANVLSLIILLLAIVNQYECKATLSDMEAAEYACYKEMGIQKEEVPDLGNFNILNEDTDNYRKMFRCLFIKIGVLDGQGNMNVEGFDNFVKLLTNSISTKDEIKNMATESLQQCKYIEGQTGGEIGLKFKNCLQNAGLEFRKKFAPSA